MRIKWQWRFPLVSKRKRCLFTNYSRLNKSIHISGLHMEWRREGRQPAPYTFIHTCSVIITCSSRVAAWGSDKYVLQFSFKILSPPFPLLEDASYSIVSWLCHLVSAVGIPGFLALSYSTSLSIFHLWPALVYWYWSHASFSFSINQMI